MPVAVLFENLFGGLTLDEILRSFPTLTRAVLSGRGYFLRRPTNLRSARSHPSSFRICCISCSGLRSTSRRSILRRSMYSLALSFGSAMFASQGWQIRRNLLFDNFLMVKVAATNLVLAANNCFFKLRWSSASRDPARWRACHISSAQLPTRRDRHLAFQPLYVRRDSFIARRLVTATYPMVAAVPVSTSGSA